MHGIIFSELQRYVDKKLGPGAWRKLLPEAGLGARTYLVTSSYPDAEAVALVTTASRLTNLPVAASRVYLGVHYLSDVLAGLAWGTAWALGATWRGTGAVSGATG